MRVDVHISSILYQLSGMLVLGLGLIANFWPCTYDLGLDLGRPGYKAEIMENEV